MRRFTLTKIVPSGNIFTFEGILFTSGKVSLDGTEADDETDCYMSLDEMLGIFELTRDAIAWIDE